MDHPPLTSILPINTSLHPLDYSLIPLMRKFRCKFAKEEMLD
jgi:hypothetical protein